jgi:hypothetical protein
LAAVALVPLCFLSGRSPGRWSKAWERSAMALTNGVMAGLCGVCLGLLGVTVFDAAAWNLLGGDSPTDLLVRAGTLGALLGLGAYASGYAHRRRWMRA